MSLQTFSFHPAIARRLPDPIFKPKGLERHVFVTPVRSLPKGLPLEPNARRPNTDRNKRVYARVEASLLDKGTTPGTFHLKNKGITVIADSVVQKGNDEYLVNIGTGHGIVDGGHTYTLIIDNQENGELPQEQFVTVEVLVGVPYEFIPEIAQGLNTSVQVQDMSLDHLRGSFNWLKDLLRPESYFNGIAWSENDEGDYDARDLVSLMMCFNMHLFPNRGEEHPVAAYEKKSTALKSYEENTAVYERMEPIVKDILFLHDTVAKEGPELWNKHNPGGKAGHLAWVDYRENKKKPHDFPFSGQKGPYRLFDGALYPILAAYRWYVEEDKGTGAMRWRVPFREVIAAWHRDAKELLTATRQKSDELGRNPNAIGKSRPHWAGLHTIVVKNDLMAQQQKTA